jgi:hypothetical protein
MNVTQSDRCGNSHQRMEDRHMRCNALAAHQRKLKYQRTQNCFLLFYIRIYLNVHLMIAELPMAITTEYS